jgi:hypothetical protein
MALSLSEQRYSHHDFQIDLVQFAGAPWGAAGLASDTPSFRETERTPCEVLGNLPDVEPSSIERRLNVVV